MMLAADIAPPNSLLLIMDRSVGQIPESMAGRLIAFTPTCVAIGTLSEHDGTTRVTLDESSGRPAQSTPTFDGVLETPGRKLSVCSVLHEVVLDLAVATERTRIRVWVNDDAEPSEIHILASSPIAQWGL
jgi:hypothetical protein